ncbi:alpha/beta hydrolase [Actinomycetospora sp. OC33-EN08]|uniref:Alpha/beta hydrolase n=1 Tax=Actinomycetospora aurantiaca TaxID=3129233 RepID=A0ABU8MT42_9PSEU
MALHPQLKELLGQFEEAGVPPFDQMTVLQAREAVAAFADLEGEPEDVAEVRDILVPGAAGEIPARVYHPAPGTDLPVLVYFHGGGWVVGDLAVADKPCRSLSAGAHVVVVSVQYRKSPETPYPGPVEDCYAAFAWIATKASELGGDPSQIVVAGDSAGGNLAAVVALMSRDRGGPSIAFQVLLYPVTAPARGTEFASYSDNADGYLLTRGSMEWFWDHYLSDPEQSTEPYASPLLAEDLAGLPPAIVVTCEFDPLRDEGRAYAQRLAAAGVEVTHSDYAGAIHAIYWLAGVSDLGRDLHAEVAEAVRVRVSA